MDTFEVFKNIYTKKIKLEKSDIDKDYSEYLINILLSYDLRNILLVNEMNKYFYHISKYNSYLFYFNSIDKLSRAPFHSIKKEKKEMDFSKYDIINWDISQDKKMELIPLLDLLNG